MTTTEASPCTKTPLPPATLFNATFTPESLDPDHLASILNRAFDFSLSARAITEVLCRAQEGELLRKLSPLDIEGLLIAIRTLALDLNREICRVADTVASQPAA